MGGILDHSFPPSFEGNPFSYAFALFSLTLICALAIAMLLQFLFEARARKAAQKIASNRICERVPFASPLSIHRWIMTGFLVTILLGGLPDVLVLFMWGEASDETMERLFLIDRICDGLTVAPSQVPRCCRPGACRFSRSSWCVKRACCFNAHDGKR